VKQAPLPAMIGRFRVLERLGSGAMGVVYRGVDEILDRPVALKVMASHGADADVRARFRREAQAAAKLQHPNIITIYELGDHHGAPFMALELLEGLDLQRAIEGGLRPDPKATMPIILQVLAGLAHAHERGIVHRDIKPSNVFLPRRRPAKIMDFGVARLVDGTSTAGMVVGTPNYMSPEQVRAGAVDGRSDLFSVGLILFELVTGERAFQGDSMVSLMYKIAHEDVDLAAIPRGAQWERLRGVLAKALAREIGDRYPDARTMSGELVLAARDLGATEDWAMAPSDAAVSVRTVAVPRPAPVVTDDIDDFAGETIALRPTPVAPAAPPAPARPAPAPPPPASRRPLAPVTFDPVVIDESELEALPEEPELTDPAEAFAPAPEPRAFPLPLVAGLAAALVLLGAGAFLVLRQPAVPSPTAPATSVAAAPVTSVAPAPVSIPSAAPPATPPPATSAPGPRPSATPRPSVEPVTGRVDRADALLSAGRFAAALAEARAVLAKDPRDEQAQQIAEEAEASLLIETVLKNARSALARGERDTAQAELRRGLAVNGNDSRLLALWREATQ
jgi:serine/threonine-protein kinase